MHPLLALWLAENVVIEEDCRDLALKLRLDDI